MELSALVHEASIASLLEHGKCAQQRAVLAQRLRLRVNPGSNSADKLVEVNCLSWYAVKQAASAQELGATLEMTFVK